MAAGERYRDSSRFRAFQLGNDQFNVICIFQHHSQLHFICVCEHAISFAAPEAQKLSKRPSLPLNFHEKPVKIGTFEPQDNLGLSESAMFPSQARDPRITNHRDDDFGL